METKDNSKKRKLNDLFCITTLPYILLVSSFRWLYHRLTLLFSCLRLRSKVFSTIMSNKLSSVKPESLATILTTLRGPKEQHKLHSRKNGFPSTSTRKSNTPKSCKPNSRKARQLCCWIRCISISSFLGSRNQVLVSGDSPRMKTNTETSKFLTTSCWKLFPLKSIKSVFEDTWRLLADF